MDNPYWSTKGQTHNIDLGTIKRMCFELVDIFSAITYSLQNSAQPRSGLNLTMRHCLPYLKSASKKNIRFRFTSSALKTQQYVLTLLLSVLMVILTEAMYQQLPFVSTLHEQGT